MEFFLIKFHNENGEEFFLHNEDSGFIGSTIKPEAEEICNNRILANISSGFEIVKVTLKELEFLIGGVPYKIYDFTNGLVFWQGVKIVEKL